MDIANSLPFSRREVLALGKAGVLLALPSVLYPGVARADAGDQSEWRFCNKCWAMFWNGAPDNKGICAADGGRHNAQGFLFSIHYDSAKPASPDVQYDWRFCRQCWTMFWDGDPNNKGRCKRGGPHVAQGLMFGLSTRPPGQSDWRFCQNCRELFWNGATNKGICPAGGGHVAQGLTFDISFKLDPADQQNQARTITLSPNVSINRVSLNGFSDGGPLGTFTHHGVDCTHTVGGSDFVQLDGLIGWGQGQAGNDVCNAFIMQKAIDFDLSALTRFIGVDRAVLTFDEAPGPFCETVFGQSSDTCWQSGGGHPENKPNGCAVVRIPSIDWRPGGVKGLVPVLADGKPSVKQLSPRQWDVTEAMNWRLNTPMGGNPGFGFLLTGSPRSLNELKGLDKTICGSSLSNIKLLVNYTQPSEGGFVPPK